MFLSLISSLVLISVTVPSVPPVCLTTSAHNVIKKPITCCDSVNKRPHKCPRKSTVVKTLSFISWEPFCHVLFTKKDNFNIAKQFFPFLIFFFFALVLILSINQKIVI